MTLTKKQREQDEQILAAIIAGAHACGRKALPHFSHDGARGSGNGYGLRSAYGPCCAVGAGALYAGVPVGSDSDFTALEVFAARYEVSEDYASGVSLGLEFGQNTDPDVRRLSYHRGFAVGKAAFEALCLPEQP